MSTMGWLLLRDCDEIITDKDDHKIKVVHNWVREYIPTTWSELQLTGTGHPYAGARLPTNTLSTVLNIAAQFSPPDFRGYVRGS